MRRLLCGLSIIALLCLVPARTAWAQAGEQGSLTGTVTDAQGGALPGVTAAAVNLQTNVTTTAVTNASGVYLLTPMVNGRYKVTFTLPGFNTAAREVEVRAGDRLRLDLGLAVGGLTEEVSVVAETPLLETTTATRSQVVAQELVENLPTLRPQSLHALTRRPRRRRRGRQPPEHSAAAVRQRRHGRDFDQRRRRPQQQLHAGRRAQYEP